MGNWTLVKDELPPEGEVVDCISPGGVECLLKREGRLWFIPDGSMYVYWTPVLWQRKS